MAEWLRQLVSGVLYRLTISLLFVRASETRQVLLAGGQVIFIGDLPFTSKLMIDTAAKMGHIILNYKVKVTA